MYLELQYTWECPYSIYRSQWALQNTTGFITKASSARRFSWTIKNSSMSKFVAGILRFSICVQFENRIYIRYIFLCRCSSFYRIELNDTLFGSTSGKIFFSFRCPIRAPF